MSATASARPRPRATAEPAHPSLRLVVSHPLSATRLPFAVFVGAILVTGLIALLLLHTMAAQDAFRLQDLQHRAAALSDTEQQLAVAEQDREAPGALAARARALGMVPTGSIAFVDLHHHGKVVGVVQPAPSPPAPVVSTPTPDPAPSGSASPAAKTAPAEHAPAKDAPAKHAHHAHA